MSLPTKHIVHQGRVVASLGGTAFAALAQKYNLVAKTPLTLPSPEIVEKVPALAPDLVRDYVRHVGGDPNAYRGTIPAHLFPQWGFPLAARTLKGIPYPMLKVLNGGCRLEQKAPLPAGVPLIARARLADIDDDGRRAVLHQVVVTGTEKEPEAVTAHLYAIVPLGGKGEKKEKREPVRVPDGARELGYFRLAPDAGLAFAMLTGDFNPVHWIKPYARAFGFRSTILHGFSTMARAIESLNRARFAGAVDRIASIDVKFTKPLVLPARVGVYTADHDVWVGDAPGGSAYLAGTFEEK
jgi:acyl dehydratase